MSTSETALLAIVASLQAQTAILQTLAQKVDTLPTQADIDAATAALQDDNAKLQQFVTDVLAYIEANPAVDTSQLQAAVAAVGVTTTQAQAADPTPPAGP